HEMLIELAIDDLLRGPDNRVGHLRINGSQACIHLCSRLLDLAQRANKGAGKTQIADRKIEERTLGAGSVISVGGDTHLAHRVALDAGLFCALYHKYILHFELACYYGGIISRRF